MVQFPVRFEKCWQLDLFLSTKSYVQVHNLHINGGGGSKFLADAHVTYVRVHNLGVGGSKFSADTYVPKKACVPSTYVRPPPTRSRAKINIRINTEAEV